MVSTSNTVQAQVEYLAQVITEIEDKMIDPIDYGQLKGKVEALEQKIDNLNGKVDQLVHLASEGKGGIRALWFAGSIVAGIIGWVGADRFFK